MGKYIFKLNNLRKHEKGLLFLGRWSRCTFPYSSCQQQLKAIAVTHETNKNTAR